MREPLSFGEALRSFWKRTFDYRGSSGREEYWIPTTFHIILLCTAVSSFFAALYFEFTVIPSFVLLAYLAVSLVPFLSLTVRRLHDTGRKGLWAGLLLFIGAGTVIVLLLCSSASSAFAPDFNQPAPLYGPPEWFESDFDPASNQNVDVYGPPEWFDGSSEEQPSEAFDPSENEPVCVYGPPEWFESRAAEHSSEETLPEPSKELPFDPSQNIAVPVYGPPAGSEIPVETR